MLELSDVTRVYGDGHHNAFTDLLQWKDHYYISFRTAQGHGVAPAGDALVLRSRDLGAWELCARLDTGGDDRDPKLIAAGDRLGVVFGTWFPRWGDGTRSVRNAEYDLISHMAVSRDGICWSTPRQVYGINYWLWRILPADGGFYCAAYHFGRRDDRDMRTIHLLRSEDLFDWHLVGPMRTGGGPGEAVLWQPEPGALHCIIRTLQPRHHSWIGQSRAPYARWQWDDLGAMIHAPVVLRVGDRWIVAGRSQEEDLPPGSFVDYGGDAPCPHHTSVWEIAGTKAEHLVTLPSGGDCSYPGLAHGLDGEVLLSYYSQHERLPLPADPPHPADVFLARFTA